MNSKMNTALGALLGVIFVLMTISIASEGIFASEAPEKPGFEIVAAEDGGEGAAPEAAVETPIAVLLASADASKGETVFKKCQACHSGEKGGPNKVGPDLWGVVDRPIASHEGFSYSSALQEFSNGGQEKWTYDHLNHFLTSPKGYVPGTAMGFAGLKKDAERADLIAYLRTLSDNPVPLPEPEAAAPAADAEAPAAEGAAAPAGQEPAAEQPAAEAPAAASATEQQPAAEEKPAAAPAEENTAPTEEAPASNAEETAPKSN
ncbi:cytochrome c family protein [Rhizobium sp. L1K21]|uniref:c-type cytochrome n=1 Tax=Rhizobium sp. L1K21 TaxID=2954933 RepID=UPI0020934017|nr:cytochrome c family protein [Rhizobium sp. L1K21]MCO6187400.1 cytochrome c family protein [Rhizobium sp. L1K21]